MCSCLCSYLSSITASGWKLALNDPTITNYTLTVINAKWALMTHSPPPGFIWRAYHLALSPRVTVQSLESACSDRLRRLWLRLSAVWIRQKHFWRIFKKRECLTSNPQRVFQKTTEFRPRVLRRWYGNVFFARIARFKDWERWEKRAKRSRCATVINWTNETSRAVKMLLTSPYIAFEKVGEKGGSGGVPRIISELRKQEVGMHKEQSRPRLSGMSTKLTEFPPTFKVTLSSSPQLENRTRSSNSHVRLSLL